MGGTVRADRSLGTGRCDVLNPGRCGVRVSTQSAHLVCMSNLRMSATERLEQLRDFVAAHDRAPPRRTGQQEERSLGDWVTRHKNAETPTGDAVRELLDSGTMTGPVNGLENYQEFCTKHMRARCRAPAWKGSRRSQGGHRHGGQLAHRRCLIGGAPACQGGPGRSHPIGFPVGRCLPIRSARSTRCAPRRAGGRWRSCERSSTTAPSRCTICSPEDLASAEPQRGGVFGRPEQRPGVMLETRSWRAGEGRRHGN